MTAEPQPPADHGGNTGEAAALFVREGGRLRPTEFCRSPWNLGTLHGGPVAGLLASACEQLADGADLICSRLTVEMMRAVPLDLLEVRAEVAKPGRRSLVIDAELLFDGRRVARATSQWLSFDPTVLPAVDSPVPPRPPHPSDPRQNPDFEYPQPGFNCDTAELRYVIGSHEEPGPGTTWIRLTSPLVAGEPTSAFVRVATISDLAAAAGWEPSPAGTNYINPDVTLQLHRLPVGPWVALEARAEHEGNGVGVMTATLYDDHGPVGRVMQSLLETPMQLDARHGR